MKLNRAIFCGCEKMIMNEKQIAFIICVNQEQEYEEAVFYLEQLHLPEGFTRDIITVREAQSMTSGYQAAMESSDAKYKVYMHQDVFIYNKRFVEEIVQLFMKDIQIGAIGMVGRRKLPEQLWVAADWDVGNIYFNGSTEQIDRQEYQNWPVEVDAVDGLLIATQYDVNWREDLFDGWDFYDISQCMELKRAGYKVVIPYQDKPWCYHDNYYSRLNKYFLYQEIFCTEYQDIRKYTNLVNENVQREREDLLEQMLIQLENFVNDGKHDQLWEIFVHMEGKIHMGFRDFCILAQIDHLERINLKESVLWKEKFTWSIIFRKLCSLKFKIKRMEFGLEEFEMGMKELHQEYSIFAIAVTTLQYASDKKYCVQKIGQWYVEYINKDMQEVWKQLTNNK